MPWNSPLMFAYGLALLVPPAVLVLNTWRFAGRLGLGRSICLSAVAIWLLVMVTATGYDRYLANALAAHDIDRDGIFSGSELTPAQNDAMTLVVNDLSRSLAPFTGAVVAILYSTAFFLGVALWRYLFRSRSAAI